MKKDEGKIDEQQQQPVGIYDYEMKFNRKRKKSIKDNQNQ